MRLVRLNESSDNDLNNALKFAKNENCSDETYDLIESGVNLLDSLSNRDIWYKAWWLPKSRGSAPGVTLGITSKDYDLEFERGDRDIHCLMSLLIQLDVFDNKRNKFTLSIAPYNYRLDIYSRDNEYRDRKDMYDQAEQIGRRILYPLSKSINGSSKVLTAAIGDTVGSMKIILDHVPTKSETNRLVRAFKELMVD